MPIINDEQKYLDFVLDYINKTLQMELDSFDELEFKYRRNPERFYVAYNLSKNLIKILKNGQDKPYFGRIDFKENGKNKEKLYIGKYGITDEFQNNIVIDWRAPVAGLYYDGEIGNVSYIAPEGVINGELFLKRQFEIEKGKLLNYNDVDIVSNDVLLQKYLNDNNDVRLKNIVSTIQSEQNMAIRKPINKNIIVQGVAGSGKTTIALHRIAYLVYNYRKLYKNNQYLVIGPNDVFIKYIKSVLPDLDVEEVGQETYEDLVKSLLDEDIQIKSSAKTLTSYLAKNNKNNIPKYKCSLEYKNCIDDFFLDYICDVCDNDLEIKGFKILDKKEIEKIFEVATEEIVNFNAAIERFVLLASNYIENHNEDIMSNFLKQKNLKTEKLLKENKDIKQLSSDYNFVKAEIEKGCKTSLRKYITKYKTSPIKLYKKFIDNIEKYENKYEYIEELKKETQMNIKDKNFDFEDLAALLHICHLLGDDKDLFNIRHVVVDEAQDLGEFNFVVLKECFKNATFSIYGDLAQSIYDYRSIDSWEEVSRILGNTEILSFNKSYRTTDEIMNVANSISEHIGIEPSELSVRSGQCVTFDKISKEKVAEVIKNKIKLYKENGYKTIAIISKYPLQSSYINDDLSFEGVFIPDITEKNDITLSENNICTISNYLSKGLEFDAVIINDASEFIYDSNNPADMKMLYVALTRALHKLDIIYTDEISEPLKKFVKKI